MLRHDKILPTASSYFMKNEAVEADALYVLGDLFEFWIGDDDKKEFATSIRQAFIDLVKNWRALLLHTRCTVCDSPSR